jgi:hypothetical protein
MGVCAPPKRSNVMATTRLFHCSSLELRPLPGERTKWEARAARSKEGKASQLRSFYCLFAWKSFLDSSSSGAFAVCTPPE